MRNQIENIENEVNNINKNKIEKNSEIEIKENLLKKENDIYSMIQEKNLNIQKNQNNINEHKTKIQNLNVNIKLMESEITQIEIKLPALEEEKKGFVQTKNFKEAGRVSHELKASIEKKEKNAQMIEKNKNDIEIFNQQLKEFDLNIEKLNEEKKEYEKELNKLRYEYSKDNLKTMNLYLI